MGHKVTLVLISLGSKRQMSSPYLKFTWLTRPNALPRDHVWFGVITQPIHSHLGGFPSLYLNLFHHVEFEQRGLCFPVWYNCFCAPTDLCFLCPSNVSCRGGDVLHFLLTWSSLFGWNIFIVIIPGLDRTNSHPKRTFTLCLYSFCPHVANCVFGQRLVSKICWPDLFLLFNILWLSFLYCPNSTNPFPLPLLDDVGYLPELSDRSCWLMLKFWLNQLLYASIVYQEWLRSLKGMRSQPVSWWSGKPRQCMQSLVFLCWSEAKLDISCYWTTSCLCSGCTDAFTPDKSMHHVQVPKFQVIKDTWLRPKSACFGNMRNTADGCTPKPPLLIHIKPHNGYRGSGKEELTRFMLSSGLTLAPFNRLAN